MFSRGRRAHLLAIVEPLAREQRQKTEALTSLVNELYPKFTARQVRNKIQSMLRNGESPPAPQSEPKSPRAPRRKK